jgi:hypothetical protein
MGLHSRPIDLRWAATLGRPRRGGIGMGGAGPRFNGLAVTGACGAQNSRPRAVRLTVAGLRLSNNAGIGRRRRVLRVLV